MDNTMNNKQPTLDVQRLDIELSEKYLIKDHQISVFTINLNGN